MGKAVKTIKVPSEIGSLRVVSSEILKSVSPYKLSETVLYGVRLCIEEAVRNAIVHGNRSNEELSVRVDYWIENDRLKIEVEDAGAGFDPDLVPDPTKSANIMRESGRGICLIKKLMDKVDFNEKGNKISMEKSLK